ncbi:MAG: nucleotidyltransferase family protein [Gammaproteobacteria bacterium]|nr:nucleotidyltransferase family protein [Gammaproteobacteria bacterium]
MTARIHIPREEVTTFCQRNHIRRLALFGSVLRDDFTPSSDIDILVEFEPNHPPIGFIGLSGMEIELSQILGRRAEIHTVPGLNPRFRDKVLRIAEVQYERAG